MNGEILTAVILLFCNLSLLSAFAYLFLFGGATKAFEGKKAKTQTPGLANGAVKSPAKGFNKGKKNG